MSTPPIVQIIHRKVDEDRLDFIREKYENAGLEFQLFEAVDGHDLEALRPHECLIAPQFWGRDWIKPGALGCFLSHYLAWRNLLETGAQWALIAEDDSRPIGQFLRKWPDCEEQLGAYDLVFLNNRICEWARGDFEPLADAILQDKEHQQIAQSRFAAPGADGYALTRRGAQHLVDEADARGSICGVDWFMVGAFWDVLEGYVPKGEEFAFVAREFEGEPIKPRSAVIAHKALFQVNRAMKSAINHSERENIALLKQALDE